jgi:hypothetical protein
MAGLADGWIGDDWVTSLAFYGAWVSVAGIVVFGLLMLSWRSRGWNLTMRNKWNRLRLAGLGSVGLLVVFIALGVASVWSISGCGNNIDC